MDWFLRDSESAFNGSEVEQFLEENANDPRLNCTTIHYCSRDFSILSHDLNSIECGEPVYNCTDYVIGHTCDITPYPEFEGQFGKVLCKRQMQTGPICDRGNGVYIRICFGGPGEPFIVPCPPPVPPVVALIESETIIP